MQLFGFLYSSKVAFVSFSTDSYIEIGKGFERSVMKTQPEILLFSLHDFSDIGSPSHKDDPYAFKMYAIDYVHKKGYDIVIWCDSPSRLVKRIDDWIPEIEKVGVYLQKDGWMCGQWANDKALDWFGKTRDEAMKISSVYACIMAFDFRHPITSQFLSLWKQCREAGLFRGAWNNSNNTESLDPRCMGHRHDQTCAELIADRLGIELQPLVLENYFKTWIEV
jgi:hypothetical protein